MQDELPENYQGAPILKFNKGDTILVTSREVWSRGFLESRTNKQAFSNKLYKFI